MFCTKDRWDRIWHWYGKTVPAQPLLLPDVPLLTGLNDKQPGNVSIILYKHLLWLYIILGLTEWVLGYLGGLWQWPKPELLHDKLSLRQSTVSSTKQIKVRFSMPGVNGCQCHESSRTYFANVAQCKIGPLDIKFSTIFKCQVGIKTPQSIHYQLNIKMHPIYS